MNLAFISALIYVFNRILFIPMLPDISFFSNYLGDLLALPVYLPLSLYLALKIQLIPANFQISPIQIVGTGIIFGILFEGVVPAINSSATRDPLDILAYFVGGLMVYSVGSQISLTPLRHNND